MDAIFRGERRYDDGMADQETPAAAAKDGPLAQPPSAGGLIAFFVLVALGVGGYFVWKWATKPAAFSCFTIDDAGRCLRDRATCTAARDEAFAAGFSATKCSGSDRAFCFDQPSRPGPGLDEMCFTNEKTCRLFQRYEEGATGCEERR